MFTISGNNNAIRQPSVFLLWVIITCMSLPSLRAQTFLGAKAGALFSTLRSTNAGSNYVTVPPHTSFSAGIMAVIPFKSHVSFQLEILFSQKGALALVGTSYYRYTLSYIEVPLMLRVNVGDKKVQGFVNAGIYGAVKTSGNNPLSNLSLDSIASISNLSGNEQLFDFGLAFGGGLQVKLGPGHVFFEPRVNLGILDIHKKDDQEHKLLSATMFLGYTYAFSIKANER